MILLPDHRPPPGPTKGQAILAFYERLAQLGFHRVDDAVMNTFALVVGLWLVLGTELRPLPSLGRTWKPWLRIVPWARYGVTMAIIPFVPLLCLLFCAAYWIELIRYGRGR